MFYTKTIIGENTTICTTLDDENVFTHCIECGSEIQVDLDEMIVDGHLDLYGTGCRCVECSRKHAMEHRGEPWAEQILSEG